MAGSWEHKFALLIVYQETDTDQTSTLRRYKKA